MSVSPLFRHTLPLLLIALFCAGAALPELTPALRWQRDALLGGEWYRLLSGHLVHANPRHAMANGLALALLWLLFQRALSLRMWLLAIPACAVAISALLFATPIDWYVGFSGVLHGLLVLALLRDPRLTAATRTLLLAAVAIKIGVELLLGTDSGAWLQVSVVREAHLFGALSGAAIAAVVSATTALRDRNATARRV